MNKKQRLDLLLIDQSLFSSREKAQSAIVRGLILVDGVQVTKAGTLVSPDSYLQYTGQEEKYVSRGGYKLEKALSFFEIDVKGRIAIDCGASTGGFTDCLLQHDVAKVYAVDVGYGQLEYKIRIDPRVKVIERTNIRHIQPETLYGDLTLERADLAVIDLSFISLLKVLPNIRRLLTQENIDIVALIKPQFEAGKGEVPPKGIIRDPAHHLTILNTLFLGLQQFNVYPKNLTFSPIKGASGNIEFLIQVVDYKCNIGDNIIKEVVQEAHMGLAQK